MQVNSSVCETLISSASRQRTDIQTDTDCTKNNTTCDIKKQS